MNIAKIKPFEEMYDLKTSILMLERLRCGMEFAEEQFDYYRAHNPEASTLEELIEEIKDFHKNWICEYIPEDVRNMWLCKDHTAYTNEFHYRKKWNEIKNDRITQYYLERIFKMLSVATESTAKSVYTIQIHDFNDFEVHFNTECGAESFVETYSVDMATLIKRGHNGSILETRPI